MIAAPPFDVGASQESVTLDRVTSDRSSWCRRERLRGTALRDNPEAVISTGAQTVNVPLDLGGRLDRHAAVEDRFLAVNDRRVGQRQLEDDCKGRRTELTHHLDVLVGDILGCGRCDGEPLDMGPRTGRCRFFLLNAVYPRFDGRLAGRLKRLLESGILKILSSVSSSLSVFVVRRGKEPFLPQVRTEATRCEPR